MNKQSLLDPFLEKSSNGGIISAARGRDSYASKRLRQVVSDFRKQKARKEANGKDEEQNQTPRITKKATKGKRAGKAVPKGKKRSSVQRNNTDEEDAKVEGEVEPSAPLSVRLRPRPKRLKVQVQSDDEGDEMSE
jgi:DNA excision repair protein ERCC-5